MLANIIHSTKAQWIFIKATGWKSWLLLIKKNIGKKWWPKFSREISIIRLLSRDTLLNVRKKTCLKKPNINKICTLRNPLQSHSLLKQKKLSPLQSLQFINKSKPLIKSSRKTLTMLVSNILILTRIDPQVFLGNSTKSPKQIQLQYRANKEPKSKALESLIRTENRTFPPQSPIPIYFQSRK